MVGRPCILSCLIEGVPSPYVSFWKGDTEILEGLEETISNYTHKGLAMKIDETEISAVGTYTCRGTNSLVSTESVESDSVTLTVYCE